MDRECKGIYIPIELWESKRLSWDEKILFFEIDSFTKKGKDCYFSDEYIADLLNCSISTAKRTLKRLIENGFVKKTKTEGKLRFFQTCFLFAFEGQNEPQEEKERVKMNLDEGQNEPQIIYTNNIYPPIVSDNKLSSTIDPQGGKTSKFVKPSIEDLKAFCLDNDLEYLDPEEFIDFYESKGWKVGSSAMKDWKAAARRWNRTNSQRPYAKKVVITSTEKEYQDGYYGKESFTPEEFNRLFSHEFDLRRKLNRGERIQYRNGRWLV